MKELTLSLFWSEKNPQKDSFFLAISPFETSQNDLFLTEQQKIHPLIKLCLTINSLVDHTIGIRSVLKHFITHFQRCVLTLSLGICRVECHVAQLIIFPVPK